MITDRQAEYRAYLTTPIWKAKRSEALAFYGCICNRCKEWGSDVHHKTYRRVGGMELMRDLEVLCRSCHEAHHAAEKVARSGRRKARGIHRRAISRLLTPKHLKILRNLFPDVSTDKYVAINCGDPQVAHKAAELLGFNYAYGSNMGPKPLPKCVLHHSGKYGLNNYFKYEFKKFSDLPKYFIDKS